MKAIKCVYNEMAGNIEEAREKMRKAYELKDTHHTAAVWFAQMAEAHIKFNNEGHNVAEKLIAEYKATDEYKRNPEYANGMIEAWRAIHESMVKKTAEVNALIASFK